MAASPDHSPGGASPKPLFPSTPAISHGLKAKPTSAPGETLGYRVSRGWAVMVRKQRGFRCFQGWVLALEAGLLLRAAGGWRPPSARAVAQRPPTLPQPVSQGPRPTWFHLFLFQAKLGSESLHRLLGQQKGCPSTQSTPDRVLLPDVPLKAVWAGRLGSPVLTQRNHWGRPRSARHPGRCGDAPGTLRPLPLTHVPPSQKPHPHHTTRAPEKRPWVPAEWPRDP